MSSPPRRLAGAGVPSSTSRARSTSSSATITSRGPAARKSGTSKPAARRSMLGMPCSESRPWIISASACWCAQATLTSLPPTRRHKLGLRDARLARSAEALDVGHVGVGERGDQVDGVGPAGQVDVGLRGIGGALGVRVVDADQILARLFDRPHQPELLLGVDRVAQRAPLRVLCPVHRPRLAVGAADHAAALVRQVLARVRDDLVDQALRNVHGVVACVAKQIKELALRARTAPFGRSSVACSARED